ncbi:MAG: phosphoenolpyruvate--protein phosphotransferase, partial [Pseudomonadota bacterium]
SDSRYVRLLLGLGLRGFSVNPESYLEVKQIITTTDMSNLERLANRMLKTSSHLDMAHLLELINAN